ncbi:hypothetical protein Tco_0620892 [Tanacetum coccineum]
MDNGLTRLLLSAATWQLVDTCTERDNSEVAVWLYKTDDTRCGVNKKAVHGNGGLKEVSFSTCLHPTKLCLHTYSGGGTVSIEMVVRGDLLGRQYGGGMRLTFVVEILTELWDSREVLAGVFICGGYEGLGWMDSVVVT